MTNYLVQYGRPAFVGRFPAAFASACARGDRVVVRGPRGLELGTVLCEPADRFARLVGDGPPGGELVRPATGDDEAAAEQLDARGHDLLAIAQQRADELGLSLALVDAEVLLDGSSAVLHGLPWGEADATPLFEELSARFGLVVRLLDLSRTPTVKDEPEPTKGCGKPGCGTDGGGCSTGSCGTGGGCSTGSCSKGKVKSADELTAYFRDLRGKMEADTARRTPLG